MRHSWICGCVLFLAACAGGDYAGPSAAVAPPPPERQGPQFVNHETVDWTPFSPIVAIRIGGLHYTKRTVDTGNVENSVEDIELQIFPSAKSISLRAIPLVTEPACTERGQTFRAQLVASPGADVSDQISCAYQGLFGRSQITLNYATTSRFSAGMLTIDGKAHLIENSIDDKGRVERDDHAIELHGSVQISGTKCRVISWRHDFPDAYTDLSNGNSLHVSNTLAAAADTRCIVVTEKTAS